jgi:TRAP-type C4-dicarboxylate transport system substrate-binding protein
MIRRLKTTLCLLATVLCTATDSATIIKLGSLAPTGSPWDQSLRRIAAEWSTLSGGAVTLKIYAGGIAGDEEDMLRKMRIGQLSAAGVTGIGLARIYTGVMALQLPLLIETDEELAFVLDRMKPDLLAGIRAQGFVVLAWSTVGWVHFFSKRPVVIPEDLKQQKLFMWAGDAPAVQAWKEDGFHPIPLAVTDMTASLQSGMVEAFSATALSAASYQWYTMTKNMCGMPWAPLIGGIIISQSAWNSIPADLQPRLLAAAETIGLDMQRDIARADSSAIVAMQQHGLVVNPVPPAAVSKWKEATKNGFAKLIGVSFDRKSYESVLKYLAEYRAAHGK